MKNRWGSWGKVLPIVGLGMVFWLGFHGGGVSLADERIRPLVDAFQQAKEGMTLWETIKAGGSMMVVLGGLSVAAVASIIYNFSLLNPRKLVPAAFSEDIIKKLDEGRIEVARSLCRRQNNIIAGIVKAGLDKRHRGVMFAREAMDNYARKEINRLWQNISYLGDIASVAPLVGLLGTVLGMIQAFNVVAFQSALVKPMLLAGGISKAMITTAGGLIIAIPAMLFHAFFKGKIIAIAETVETYNADIMKIMEKL